MASGECRRQSTGSEAAQLRRIVKSRKAILLVNGSPSLRWGPIVDLVNSLDIFEQLGNMKKMNAANFDEKYNDELSLIDSLYGFHPEYFGQLSEAQREILRRYYLYDSESPDNIFDYRVSLLAIEPGLEVLAQKALSSLSSIAQIHTP